MENKSLIKNVVYYFIKTIVSIIFPLITYKYAAAILGAENMGKVEFAKSFMGYFLLLANLGINAFAVRNGAGFRNNKRDLENFAGRIFGINCISSLGAITLFILFVFSGIDIKIELELGYIFLIQIPLNLIGVEWLYNIYEDFEYITYRSLVCQIIALIFMFAFVRTPEQYINYALTLVFASHGAYVFNWIRSKKYIRIKPIIDKKSLPLLVPILILFSNSIATSIYVNLDISILGFMRGGMEVGIYSAAVKVYTAIKSVISTMLLVALPRMSYYAKNNNTRDYNNTESKIVDFLILFVPACIAGLIMQSRNLILLVSGSGFETAVLALVILGGALLFSSIGMVCGTTILLPDKKEKIVLISTIMGAVTNFVLNLVFIPIIGIYGAALTTLVSELLVSVIQISGAKYRIKQLKIDYKHTVAPAGVGIVAIIIVNLIVGKATLDYKLNLIFCIILSVIIYFIIAYLCKNSNAERVVAFIKRK